MSNNDKFFDMFKDSLEGYSPKVPASVHSGIRSKMRMNNFFHFSMTSLNVWTILALTAIGGGLWYSTSANNTIEAKKIELPSTNSNFATRVVAKTEKTDTFIASIDNNHVVKKITSKNSNHKTKSHIAKKKKQIDPLKKSIERKPQVKTPTKKSELPENTIVTNDDKNKMNTTNEQPKEILPVFVDNAEDNTTQSNRFFGLIKTKKFQTTSKGINTELKDKSKKDFTIKIKVPK